MNKEIEDALCMLLHCSLKDTEYESQREQFEFIYKYIENLEEENQELKKQLESANEQVIYLRRSIERKEEKIINLQDERIPYKNEYVDKLLNQQKEFIKYLKEEINNTTSRKEQLRNKKAILVLETRNRNYNTILQKYKSIIGVLDEKEN